MSAQPVERRYSLPGAPAGVRLRGIGAFIRRAFQAGLDMLYPPRCGGCGVVGEGFWCPGCEARTPRFGLSERLRTLEPAVEASCGSYSLSVVSAAPFTAPLREGIHEFKYNGAPQLAEPFARLMLQAWIGASAGGELVVDLVVPVPLHAGRLRERGFNQSERLAFYVARHIGIPMMPHALARTRHTEHQARLGAAERRANVQGAFAADGAHCAGRRILLVDDVLTTGTTLCECTAALLDAGAVSVSALTLARAGQG
ncbi:MAG: ComF family protein [Anaerolineae bacterium]|nr:ComF family protein [Thermoflexales bacterium]MDW8407713.1 ComF family protein [Anaerolineae bacterium]